MAASFWPPLAPAAEPTTSDAGWKKPAWLTTLSLGIKESYDSNVFVSDVDQGMLDKAGIKTLRTGDFIYTSANQSAWVTAVSPKIEGDLAPLLGKESLFQTLSLGYQPDFSIYAGESSENNTAHRFPLRIKGKADAFSFNLENTFTWIDGRRESPIYLGGFYSVYATATVRERREQTQDRSKVFFRYDTEHFFIRPTASLLYYNLDTALKEVPNQAPLGYQNWIDRYDVNGGCDFGFKPTKDFAVMAGYRYGYQYQATLPWDEIGINASNLYQRALLGMEGSPVKWLKIDAVAGPDFRNYNETLSHITITTKSGKILEANINQDRVHFFAECAATLTPTSLDTLVIKYKQWLWVSSTGRVPYRDSLFDANFRHKMTKSLTLELGAKVGQSDYDPAALRNDWLYSGYGGVKYAVNAHLGVDLTYSYDRGDNGQADLRNPTFREFQRSLVSLGATWKF